MNIQYGNVGNRGDVLKHAALVVLANLVKTHARGSTTYVETHAFLPEAPLPDWSAWRALVDEYAHKYPAYEAYRAAEQPYVVANRYRCSTGLALDTLNPAHLYLAERDAPTRSELQSQLASVDAHVVADLSHLPGALVDNGTGKAAGSAPASGADGVLMLVDPFKLPDAIWPRVAAITVALARAGHGARSRVIEVFAYSHDNVSWPAPPPGYEGPVACLDEAPFHLASYAAPDIARDVVATLGTLGWSARTSSA